MVDLEALERIAELTYKPRAKIIREAIAELRRLRALEARVEGAPVACVDDSPIMDAANRAGYYQGKRLRLVAESGEDGK